MKHNRVILVVLFSLFLSGCVSKESIGIDTVTSNWFIVMYFSSAVVFGFLAGKYSSGFFRFIAVIAMLDAVGSIFYRFL